MDLTGGSLSISCSDFITTSIEPGRGPAPRRATAGIVRALEHDRRRRADQNGLRDALGAVPPMAPQGVDFSSRTTSHFRNAVFLFQFPQKPKNLGWIR